MGCNQSSDAAEGGGAARGTKGDAARGKRLAKELQAAHGMYDGIDFPAVGAALRENFIACEQDPSESVAGSIDALLQFRDFSGIFIPAGGGFANGHRDVPRHSKGVSPATKALAAKHPNLASDIAAAMKLSPADLKAAVSRMVDCYDTLLVEAVEGTPLAADADEEHSAATYRRAAEKFAMDGTKADAANWDDAAAMTVCQKRDGLDKEDETVEQLLGGTPPSARKRFALLRLCGETLADFLLFLHGARDNFAPAARSAAAARAEVTSHAVSSVLFAAFTRFCAQPSRGMESALTVEQEGAYWAAVVYLCGFIPASAIAQDFEKWTLWLPYPLLTPPAKSAVVYVACILTSQRKLDIRHIERPAILQSAIDAVAASGSASSDAASSKVFPVFEREAGEGHGPRKEFFDCCAAALESAFASPLPLADVAVVDTEEGRATVTVRTKSPGALRQIAEALTAGSRVEFPIRGGDRAEAKFVAVIVTATNTGQAMTLRLDAMVPTANKGAPLHSVQRRQPPCFALPGPGAAFCWFSEAVEDGCGGKALGGGGGGGPTAPNTPQWVFDRYYLAGWLCGAAITNGVCLPLPLPAVFFKVVRQAVLAGDSDSDSDDGDFVSDDGSGGKAPLVDARDLCELDDANVELLQRLRAMSAVDFDEYEAAMLDDDDALPDSAGVPLAERVEAFIARELVQRTLVGQCRQRIAAAAAGFRATLVPSVGCFAMLHEADLQGMVCGEVDDGAADFDFDEHFNVVYEDDFATFRHSFVFKRLVVDALKGAHVQDAAERAAFKRALLKFITGRSRLPPHRKVESITVAGGDMMTCKQFKAGARRLPSSHTCSNTLEVPNYLECFMFEPAGPAAVRSSLSPQSYVNDELKEDAWSALGDAARTQLRRRAQETLIAKLMLAVGNADTYELDERDNDDDDDDDDGPARGGGGGGGGRGDDDDDDDDDDAGSGYEMPEEDVAQAMPALGASENHNPLSSGPPKGEPTVIVAGEDDEYALAGDDDDDGGPAEQMPGGVPDDWDE
jgi:hypothetical protein